MHTSARCLVLLLGIELLSGAEPSGRALPGIPLPPIRGQEAEDSLPAPRVILTVPQGEEPAPAPREQMIPPNGGLAPPVPAPEEAAPMPREQTPAPPRLAMPGFMRSASPAEVRSLHHEIEGLRMEREAMLNEQMSLLATRGPDSGESAQLRRRITELLSKTARASKNKQAQAPPVKSSSEKSAPQKTTAPNKPPSAPPASPSQPVPPVPSTHTAQPGRTTNHADNSKPLTDAPVDPLTLAQTLFLAGDHAGA